MLFDYVFLNSIISRNSLHAQVHYISFQCDLFINGHDYWLGMKSYHILNVSPDFSIVWREILSILNPILKMVMLVMIEMVLADGWCQQSLNIKKNSLAMICVISTMFL